MDKTVEFWCDGIVQGNELHDLVTYDQNLNDNHNRCPECGVGAHIRLLAAA